VIILPISDEEKEIKAHMENMDTMLKTGSHLAISQAAYDFGTFLQKTFPGKDRDEIRKELQTLKDYENDPFPPFKEYSAVKEGVIGAKMNASELPNPTEMTTQLDAIDKGLTTFGNLLGREKELSNQFSRISDEDFTKGQDSVNNFIISNYQKQSEALSTIEQMKSDTAECEAYLSKIISQEANKMPVINQHYAPLPSIPLNVSQVAADFSNPTSVVHENASPKLVDAIKSYNAIKLLQNTLNSPQTDPIKKLQEVRKQDNVTSVKSAFESSSDSTVKRFFTKLMHIITRNDTYQLTDKLDKKIKANLDVGQDNTPKMGR